MPTFHNLLFFGLSYIVLFIHLFKSCLTQHEFHSLFISSSQNLGKGLTERISSGVPPSYFSKRASFYFIWCLHYFSQYKLVINRQSPIILIFYYNPLLPNNENIVTLVMLWHSVTILVTLFNTPDNLTTDLLILHYLCLDVQHLNNWLYQGNLIQGEGSDSLKTALETKRKTA